MGWIIIIITYKSYLKLLTSIVPIDRLGWLQQAMQSAMQMQNASRIFTVAPWSGLQQVIHSVEASCMRGERESGKWRAPTGEPSRWRTTVILVARRWWSKVEAAVSGGSCAGRREGWRRAAAACAASPATRLVSIHGSPRCHTPASADLAPFAAPSVWAQIRPCSCLFRLIYAISSRFVTSIGSVSYPASWFGRNLYL